MRRGELDLDRGAVLFLFRRGSAGRITSLTAATQRVQNLRFTGRGS